MFKMNDNYHGTQFPMSRVKIIYMCLDRTRQQRLTIHNSNKVTVTLYLYILTLTFLRKKIVRIAIPKLLEFNV